jgi:Bacterial PH domain
MSHDDYALEPDPSAPGQLPHGETVLWQGRPDWVSLAWRVYHLREVSAYFALLITWRGFSTWWDSGLPGKGVMSTLPLLLPFCIAAALIIGIAIVSARTTRYTITSNRLVLKIGMAMPASINLPFAAVGAASHRPYGEGLVARGSGDIGVALIDNKLAYAVLWPHVRPWHLRNPQPMLRCVPESAAVARVLSQALAGDTAPVVATTLARKAVPAKPAPGNASNVSNPLPDGRLAV